MADRGVFLAAFLALVLVVASAFALPQLFIYELLTSTIFVVIAVMVFFGDDKFPYMLGIIAPLVWFAFSLLTGGFVSNMATLAGFLSGKPSGPLETPLHGFAILAALALVILSARAWRKQVTDKFLGKNFAVALVVSVVWVGAIAAWQFHALSSVPSPH
jgi:hypothetical protein